MGPGGPQSLYTPRNLVFGLSNHVFTGKPVFGGFATMILSDNQSLTKIIIVMFFFLPYNVVAILAMLPETFEQTFIPQGVSISIGPRVSEEKTF